MMRLRATTSILLTLTAITSAAIGAQSMLVEVMRRHGIEVRAGAFDAAFDANVTPSVPVTSGSFATPLALLTSTVGRDRIDAAYGFGILAGRGGGAAAAPELASAGQALVLMMNSGDRRTRIAGARVAGRLFAAPYDPPDARSTARPEMIDGFFAMLNEDDPLDQLAAMDALGMVREASAVTSLTERYRFYRDQRLRALAGGALEALARIGDPSSAALVKELTGDPWADGKDSTALAVAFARERLLKDGSIAVIRQALDDRARRDQARGYLIELGAPVR